MSPRFFELWASVDDCSLLPAACRFSEMDFKWAVIHHDGAPLQRPDANSYITMFVETNELHRGPHTGSRTHQHVGGDSCVSLKSVHLKNAYSSHVKSRPLSQWWCSAEVFWIFEYEFWFRPFAHTVFLFFSGLYLFFFFFFYGGFWTVDQTRQAIWRCVHYEATQYSNDALIHYSSTKQMRGKAGNNCWLQHQALVHERQ